jgi:hypothetical protein
MKSYNRWIVARANGTNPELTDCPLLAILMDMGWNGKGSGRTYDQNLPWGLLP